jgi:hypothetical protein
MSEFLYGYSMTGAFGYSHLTGGYAGGQAEYVRVPYSDIGPIVICGRRRREIAAGRGALRGVIATPLPPATPLRMSHRFARAIAPLPEHRVARGFR